MIPKDILLLENIRFYHQEEEENDLSFSKHLQVLVTYLLTNLFLPP